MCLFTKPTHSIYHTMLLLPGSSGGAAPPRAVSSLTVLTLLMHGPILSHKLPVQGPSKHKLLPGTGVQLDTIGVSGDGSTESCAGEATWKREHCPGTVTTPGSQ